MNPFIIDTGAKERNGLLAEFESTTYAPLPTFTSIETVSRGFRLVQSGVTPDIRPWDEIDMSTTGLEVGISNADLAPTAGTWSLSFNGDSTGLTALAYNITASALQTALNANPAITTAGGVTVTQSGRNYTVIFNTVGAQPAFVATSGTLIPPSNVYVQTYQDGTGSVQEVQSLRVEQRPLAYQNTWTVTTAGAIAALSVVSGTAAIAAVQQVSITGDPYGGSWSLTWPRPEVTSISFTANTAAKQKFTIVPVANTAHVLNNTFFDTSDDAGPVRVWFDSSSTGTAPATPTGGRLIEVNIANNDSAAVVAAAIQSTLDADSKFVASILSGITVTVESSTAGTRTGPTDGTTPTGFTFATVTAGTVGVLSGAVVLIYDVNGSVGIWLNTGGLATPADAASARRQIPVTIAAGDTASTVATAVQTALDADAEFTATVSGNLVTITDVAGGIRPIAPSVPVGEDYIGVATVTPGDSLTVTVPWDVSEEVLGALLNNEWLVTLNRTSTTSIYTFTGTSNGARSTFSVAANTLVWAKYYAGDLSLNTFGMQEAFNATTDDSITAVFEARMTPSGGSPQTILRLPVTVFRSVLDSQLTASTPAVPATISLTGDVTGSGTTSIVTTIANDVVTFAKMQNISTSRILGRTTASSGDIEQLTVSGGLALAAGDLTIGIGTYGQISVTSAGVWDLNTTAITGQTADASPDGAADYVLTYDASANTFKKVLLNNLPSSGGISDGDKGDITVSSGGTVWTIDDAVIYPQTFADADWGDMSVSSGLVTIDAGAVTFSKFQNISNSSGQGTLLGQTPAGSGDMVELELGVGFSFTGSIIENDIIAQCGNVDNSMLRANAPGGGRLGLQNSALTLSDETVYSSQYYIQLLAAGAQTNNHFVITPKGNGSIIVGPEPSASRNNPGIYALDLQCTRNSAGQVASGDYSKVFGNFATASGEGSTAISCISNTAFGGCTASGQRALAMGRNVTASGIDATAIMSGTASNSGARVWCWESGTASGENSTAIGNRATATRSGEFSVANGRFGSDGDVQRVAFVMRRVTTNNTPTELFLDGSSARLTIPSGTGLAGIIQVFGFKSDGSAAAHYIRQYAVKNVGGTTSEIYAEVTIGTDTAAGTALDLSASDANDALIVTVTGITAETWRWEAYFDGVHLAYGT